MPFRLPPPLPAAGVVPCCRVATTACPSSAVCSGCWPLPASPLPLPLSLLPAARMPAPLPLLAPAAPPPLLLLMPLEPLLSAVSSAESASDVTGRMRSTACFAMASTSSLAAPSRSAATRMKPNKRNDATKCAHECTACCAMVYTSSLAAPRMTALKSGQHCGCVGARWVCTQQQLLHMGCGSGQQQLEASIGAACVNSANHVHHTARLWLWTQGGCEYFLHIAEWARTLLQSPALWP